MTKRGRRAKGEAIGTQETGSGNGDHKIQIKGEAMATQEKGYGHANSLTLCEGQSKL